MNKATVFEGVLAIILLILLVSMYAMLASGQPAAAGQQDRAAEPVYFMATGVDGLYTFRDSGISYYDKSGELRWTYEVPPRWKILMDGGSYVWVENRPNTTVMDTRPIYAMDNGTLYLYAIENATWRFSPDRSLVPSWAFSFYGNESELNRTYEKKIMAIASDGRELWNFTVREKLDPFTPDDLKARGGLVYFHHGQNETVLDGGRVSFTVNNVSDPAAVDEEGNVYAVKARIDPRYAIKSYPRGPVLYYSEEGPDDQDIAAYYVPSETIGSFYPNGTVRWAVSLGEDACRQYYDASVKGRYDSLPLYHNGTLYVPVKNGIVALDTNGNEMWRKTFGSAGFGLLEVMPVDENGSIYLRRLTEPRDIMESYPNYHPYIGGGSSNIYVLSSAGEVISPGIPFNYNDNGVNIGDGVLYTSRQVDGRAFGGLMTNEVQAYDLGSGALAWSYRIPVNDARMAMGDYADAPSGTGKHWGPQYRTVLDPPPGKDMAQGKMASYEGTIKQSYAVVLPAGDRAYISFRSTSKQFPPDSTGKYLYWYCGGIYALDRNGSLIWSRSLDSPVTAMAANNTTIIYGTGDGGLSIYTVDTAAGLTLAALFYFFVRFFLVGAVSRARDRLGVNENRNRVLEYVKAHPGSTLNDMARDLKMNFGTVRYHVLILGLNRRIVSIRADDRYVRYFKNSGAYSKDEQVAISLMRREGIRKVLGVLMDKPGLTNSQLSKELQVSESAVSKSMRSLVASGIVVKKAVDGKAIAYSIDEAYCGHIADAARCLQGQ